MPRASDRPPSLRPAARSMDDGDNERGRTTKRKRCPSLPATDRPAMTMNEAKFRRSRRSLSLYRQNSGNLKSDDSNNENKQPNRLRQGPTPYSEVRY